MRELREQTLTGQAGDFETFYFMDILLPTNKSCTPTQCPKLVIEIGSIGTSLHMLLVDPSFSPRKLVRHMETLRNHYLLLNIFS